VVTGQGVSGGEHDQSVVRRQRALAIDCDDVPSRDRRDNEESGWYGPTRRTRG
jgi:hypothetical protein